jgi:hypothetical protein
MNFFNDNFGTSASTSRAAELVPPRWQHDDDIRHCQQCGLEFTMFKRQHHCRVCGKIFCDNCSNNRKLLPEQFHSFDPQRVCDPCGFIVEPEQARLLQHRTNASQQNALRDGQVTGGSRRYLNQPIRFELGAEIRKAAWALRNQMDGLQTELGDEDVQESQLRVSRACCTLRGNLVRNGLAYNNRAPPLFLTKQHFLPLQNATWGARVRSPWVSLQRCRAA